MHANLVFGTFRKETESLLEKRRVGEGNGDNSKNSNDIHFGHARNSQCSQVSEWSPCKKYIHE